jgi:hypothetical protein
MNAHISADGVLERKPRPLRPHAPPPPARRDVGMFTGSTRGFSFRRIGYAALRHTVRAIEFRGMAFVFVTCAPFAGTGATTLGSDTDAR